MPKPTFCFVPSNTFGFLDEAMASWGELGDGEQATKAVMRIQEVFTSPEFSGMTLPTAMVALTAMMRAYLEKAGARLDPGSQSVQ